MNGGIVLALAAPVAGSVLSLTLRDPRERRGSGWIAVAFSVFASGAMLWRTIDGEVIVARGFSADAWRAGLTLGVALALGAALLRSGDDRHAASRTAAAFAFGGATNAAILGGTLVVTGVFLAASSMAMAIAALATEDRLRALRGTAGLFAADACALVAFALASRRGLGVPPRPDALVSTLLLAGGAVRLGLAPFAWVIEDLWRANPALGALASGAVRAQGLLLCAWAVARGGEVGVAAAALGAGAALWAGARAVRDGHASQVAAAQAGLILLGISVGGVAALWGGILLAAGGFLSWPAWFAGGAAADAARPSLGAWALGATLPGAVLVLRATFDAGAGHPGYLALAVPAAAVAVALAVAALGAPSAEPARPSWPALLPLAAGLALAVLPERALSGLAFPASDALGGGRLLGAQGPAGLGDDLGVAAAVAAGAALLLMPGGLRRRRASSGRERREARVQRWAAWWGGAAPIPSARSGAGAVRAYLQRQIAGGATALAAAAAVGCAGWLYAIGVRRGFL